MWNIRSSGSALVVVDSVCSRLLFNKFIFIIYIYVIYSIVYRASVK